MRSTTTVEQECADCGVALKGIRYQWGDDNRNICSVCFVEHLEEGIDAIDLRESYKIALQGAASIIAAKCKRIEELHDQVDEIWHKYQCAKDNLDLSQTHCRIQFGELSGAKIKISKLKIQVAALTKDKADE